MAKETKKKEGKPRAKNYDPKLAIKGTFEDVISVSVGKQAPAKKEEKKK
jgi:hypothetical protein